MSRPELLRWCPILEDLALEGMSLTALLPSAGRCLRKLAIYAPLDPHLSCLAPFHFHGDACSLFLR